MSLSHPTLVAWKRADDPAEGRAYQTYSVQTSTCEPRRSA